MRELNFSADWVDSDQGVFLILGSEEFVVTLGFRGSCRGPDVRRWPPTYGLCTPVRFFTSDLCRSVLRCSFGGAVDG